MTTTRLKKSTAGNRTYKKLAVQWLNEAVCFVSSSVVADSFVLRNRQLLVAEKRVCLESFLMIAIKKTNVVQNMKDFKM